MGDAKRRFQRIQEAYSGKCTFLAPSPHVGLLFVNGRQMTPFWGLRSCVPAVLSDQGKRAMYDAGLYDPLEDDDQVWCSEIL